MNLLVRIINRLFRFSRYRIEIIPYFKVEVNRLIKTGRKIKFIQVGANDGVSFDDLFQYVTGYHWSGVAIEPLNHVYNRLVINYEDYKEVIPLRVAVHPTEKEIVIYRVSRKFISQYPDWVSGIASVNRSHLINNGVDDYAITAEKVPCMHLRDIVINYKQQDADILQIDTEGFDAEVIRMIDFDIFSPTLIKYESGNLSPRDNSEIQNLLKSHGYKLYQDGIDSVAVKRH